MSGRDFVGDVEAETEPLSVAHNRAAIKWLKKTRKRSLWDGLAGVHDGKFKGPTVACRLHEDRLVGRAIRKGVAEKIREELRNAVPNRN